MKPSPDILVPAWQRFWREAFPGRAQCSLDELQRLQVAAQCWDYQLGRAIAESKAQAAARTSTSQRRAAA